MARFSAAKKPLASPTESVMSLSKPTILIRSLVVEAESAYRDVDATSTNGIQYVRDNLCFPLAAGSFEAGMGA